MIMSYFSQLEQCPCTIGDLVRVFDGCKPHQDAEIADSLALAFSKNPSLSMMDVASVIPRLTTMPESSEICIKHMMYGHPESVTADELCKQFPEISERITLIDTLYNNLAVVASSKEDEETLPRAFGSKLNNGVQRYQLTEKIGSGSQGVVYRATDLMFETRPQVAVKIFRTPGVRVAEANATFLSKHPGVVEILEHGSVEGQGYAVYELLDGEGLDTFMPVNPQLDWRDKVKIILRVCETVVKVHACGILHRDIKPKNIMMTESRGPVLTDFGVAIERSYSSSDLPGGSVCFAAPEQFNDRATPASDVYGLAGVLYWMITRHPPNSESPEIAVQNLKARKRPVTHDMRCPDRLKAVLDRALDPDQFNRTSSAAEFADDLRRVLAHRPINWMDSSAFARTKLMIRRSPLPIAACIGAVLLVGAGYIAQNHREQQRADELMSGLASVESDRDSIQEQLSAEIERLIAEKEKKDKIIEGMNYYAKLASERMNSLAMSHLVRPGVDPQEALKIGLYLEELYAAVPGMREADLDQQLRMAQEAVVAMPDDTRPEDLATAHMTVARIAQLADSLEYMGEQIAHWTAARDLWAEILPADAPILARLDRYSIEAGRAASVDTAEP
jgi:serine/threonine-protein kinase